RTAASACPPRRSSDLPTPQVLERIPRLQIRHRHHSSRTTLSRHQPVLTMSPRGAPERRQTRRRRLTTKVTAAGTRPARLRKRTRSEEHTSELQSREKL